MKKFQSYNHFESEWKSETTPDINLDKIKSRLNNLQGTDNRTYKDKKRLVPVIAVLIFTLCFGTVVMALYNGWQLMNKQGDVLLEYVKGDIKEMNRWVRGWHERLKFMEAEDEVMANLKPGETTYFLVVKEYEISKQLVVLQDEVKITDLDKLQKSTSTKFKIPKYLPDTYRFEYGIVTFKAKGEGEKLGEELYQEAKKAGKDYIIKNGTLTKEAKEITLKYVNDEGYRLTLKIGDITQIRSHDYDYDSVEKFSVSDKEVLHITSKHGDADRYVFVDEDTSKNLTYRITNESYMDVYTADSYKTSLPLSKEEAAKMINSF